MSGWSRALWIVVLGLGACVSRVPPEVPAREFVVFFPSDGSALTDGGREVVTLVAAEANKLRAARLTVEGQSDGASAHAAEIAQDRGAAVVAALEQAGVPPAEIEQRPSAPPAGTTGISAHKVVVRLTPG